MPKFILFLLFISGAGFFSGLLTFICSLLRVTGPFDKQWNIFLIVSCIIYGLSIVFSNDLRTMEKRLGFWKSRTQFYTEMFKFCPIWMRYTVHGLSINSLINMLSMRGSFSMAISPVPPDVIRGVSSFWMLLCGSSFCILFSRFNQQGRERSQQISKLAQQGGPADAGTISPRR